jgi:hypothetical protein
MPVSPEPWADIYKVADVTQVAEVAKGKVTI